MQIAKLSDDDICENSENCRRITKIAPAAKTPGRYNIFVNEKYSFSLDELQFANSRIKKGDEISAAKLAELKNDSDFGKNYIRALDLFSRRIRSEKEIRDYGFRKNWTRENVEKVIARLREKNYLDDEKFAISFVRSRANLRNFSRRKMEVELIKKGISREIIAKTLAENSDFDEGESLKKLIAKKQGKYDDERKLIAYLARAGFSYDKIKSAISELREESEAENA